MKDEPLMKCGHIGTAIRDGKPFCVMCMCGEVVDGKPSLEGRVAKCSCGRTEESDWGLPFFEYKPDCEHDEWYCGHYGWD